MALIWYYAIFVLGLIVGSFLNVVVFRYNTGLTLGGRSRCLSCAKTLHWYELIPVLSFAAQGGRCRTCQAAIAWQYPAVELATGLVFLSIYNIQYLMGPSEGPAFIPLAYSIVVASLLLVITVYDVRHKIIPDGMVFAFDALALLAVWSRYSLTDLAAGFLFFLAFAGIWFFSSGTWMGLGDAKLALGIGWILPFPESLMAIVVAFWIGAAVGISLLAVRRANFTVKTELPFAPFLVLGLFLVYALGIRLS